MKKRGREVILAEVETTLREHYPTLHLKTDAKFIYVWGIFPVKFSGKILDRYRIEIQIDDDYPQSVPLVWEVGNKIPRDADHHVYPDGNLCLFFPDARVWYWSYNGNFLEFLTQPVNDFFLSQIYFQQEGKWPFGEMRHGIEGAYDFYSEKLEVDDIEFILKAFDYLKITQTRKRPKGHWRCYCGSGKAMRVCHFENLKELHTKVASKNIEHWIKLFHQHKAKFIKW